MNNKAPVTLTNAAVDYLKGLIEKCDKKTVVGIRLSVKSGGCSGYSYSMDYAFNSTPMDEIIQLNGVKLFIDKKAILFIIGTTIDYSEDTFTSGLVFNNPKEKNKCGCGKSVGF